MAEPTATAHPREKRVPVGSREGRPAGRTPPHVQGARSCTPCAWPGGDRRRGGRSPEAIFRGRQSPRPPPPGSGVGCPPSAWHREGVDVWMPSQGLFLGVGSLPERGIQCAWAELGPRWLALAPPGSRAARDPAPACPSPSPNARSVWAEAPTWKTGPEQHVGRSN